MKSIATVWKGKLKVLVMGYRGGCTGCILILFI